MSHAETAIVIAAHAEFSGRVIVWALFPATVRPGCTARSRVRSERSREQSCTRTDRRRRSRNRGAKFLDPYPIPIFFPFVHPPPRGCTSSVVYRQSPHPYIFSATFQRNRTNLRPSRMFRTAYSFVPSPRRAIYCLRVLAFGDGAMQEPVAEAHEEKETGRLEAFSDGVFAIAITLLVLDLKVPATGAKADPPRAQLGKALLQQWPSYIGLVTSFFTVLIMWVHHHAILRNVCKTDAWLHFANGCLLFGVTFVPYPTSILTTYLKRPRPRWRQPSIPEHLCLCALCFYLLIRAAFRKPLLSASASEEFIDKTCHDLYVWAAGVFAGDIGRDSGRAPLTGDLYHFVDFLGHDDYAKYARLGTGKFSDSSRQVVHFRCACPQYREATSASRDFPANPSAAAQPIPMWIAGSATNRFDR